MLVELHFSAIDIACASKAIKDLRYRFDELRERNAVRFILDWIRRFGLEGR